MSEEGERRVILTDVEWWVKPTGKGDLYARISSHFERDNPAAVKVTYHPGSPAADAELTKINRSIVMAQHLLIQRGFRRFER